ncbi:hypothetical protein [Alkalihalobacterium bogoriense]|uniref:hypothetical protein n=1 Tax=Alkalihalobacterium bogoriense TaxID=246272 RepID=UPI0005524D40|nr:hypothetical protein [Alkalihalobacterium bogoriense]
MVRRLSFLFFLLCSVACSPNTLNEEDFVSKFAAENEGELALYIFYNSDELENEMFIDLLMEDVNTSLPFIHDIQNEQPYIIDITKEKELIPPVHRPKDSLPTVVLFNHEKVVLETVSIDVFHAYMDVRKSN